MIIMIEGGAAGLSSFLGGVGMVIDSSGKDANRRGGRLNGSLPGSIMVKFRDGCCIIPTHIKQSRRGVGLPRPKIGHCRSQRAGLAHVPTNSSFYPYILNIRHMEKMD